MNNVASKRPLALAIGGLMLGMLAGCSTLRPTPVQPPAFYAIDLASARMPIVPRQALSGPEGAPTLVVSPPRAGAGFDSPRIIYLRQPHRLEYFAHSEWVEPPARMLAPLIVAVLHDSGAFHAVVSTPAASAGELRLDTEIVRLQHEFGAVPSQVRLTLRATLSDSQSREVMAQADFDIRADAASEDAYGGVLAANHATRAALQALSAWCGQVAAQWQARGGKAFKRAAGTAGLPDLPARSTRRMPGARA